jgi:glucose-6-phosphate isomerase
MKSHAPIRCDLNNLFRPAIPDGPEGLAGFEAAFAEAHRGIAVMKETGHLPFANLPADSVLLQQIVESATRCDFAQDVVLMGIGGSSLGPQALYQALYGPYAALRKGERPQRRLFVLDTIDPRTCREVLETVTPTKTLFLFISKSGNTAETLAQYLFVRARLPDLPEKNFFAITDPKDGFLRQLATEKGWPTLPIPVGVGGRFSVFSPVGLFPLALCGADVVEIAAGAAQMEKRCRSARLTQNPAGVLAVILRHWTEGPCRQVVMMPYGDRLRFFADWFAQLWGESLGKRTMLSGERCVTGTTPIKALGVLDQHSQLQLYLEGPRDKLVCFVAVDDWGEAGNLNAAPTGDERADFLLGKSLAELLSAECQATAESLRENARPNATIWLSSPQPHQLGQLFQLFMNVIPYLGVFAGINPFDQPAVERIKKLTFGLMGKKGYEDLVARLVNVSDGGFIF